MRKAGVKVPICGTNWQAHGFATRVHMLGQSRLDYIDRHGYWDHPQGEGNLKWRLATALFHDLPMVKAVDSKQDVLNYLGKGNLVTEKAWEQVLGLPMTISEWNTCLPNEYSLEGTGLMAAYGLLQGWDGLLEFGYFSPDWRDNLARGSFDLFSNPPQILQFPAVAAMWHRQDVARRTSWPSRSTIMRPSSVWTRTASPCRSPPPWSAKSAIVSWPSTASPWSRTSASIGTPRSSWPAPSRASLPGTPLPAVSRSTRRERRP